MTCARCEDLEAEIAYLRSELGLSVDATRVARLTDHLRSFRYAHLRGRTGVARLLLALYDAHGRVLTRPQLLDAIPPASGDEDTRSTQLIDALVWGARSALGKDAIVNLWGCGYALSPEGMAKVAEIVGAPTLAGEKEGRRA